MRDYTVSYAQNREDVILSGFFKGTDNGFYVDVGANHPDMLSVTKLFYDKGWRGINIEPNAHLHKLIQQQRPRDINLNIGAADESGELVLREYPGGDGLSTFSKETQSTYQKKDSVYKQNTLKYDDRKVVVKPLKQIFKDNKVDTINFMNIDVEGFEYNVIKGNDWTKYRPQVICIEANHIVHDWRPLLTKAQYNLVFFDGLNNYYVAAECQDIAERFSYVDTVLLGKPVVNAEFHEELQATLRHARQLEHNLVRQGLIEQNLRGEIHNLNSQIARNGRLRSIVKQLAGGINRAILVQIEKLNKPRTKGQAPLKVNDGMKPNELLQTIKLYDVNNYYNSKASSPVSYRVVYGLYTSFYELIKKSARRTIKTLRGNK